MALAGIAVSVSALVSLHALACSAIAKFPTLSELHREDVD